jgi:hypothetical protein
MLDMNGCKEHKSGRNLQTIAAVMAFLLLSFFAISEVKICHSFYAPLKAYTCISLTLYHKAIILLI